MPSNEPAGCHHCLFGLSRLPREPSIWAAWSITRDIEAKQQAILAHEIAGTPADRRAADLLRSQIAYRSRLHAALLPGHLEIPAGTQIQTKQGLYRVQWMSAGIPPISI